MKKSSPFQTVVCEPRGVREGCDGVHESILKIFFNTMVLALTACALNLGPLLCLEKVRVPDPKSWKTTEIEAKIGKGLMTVKDIWKGGGVIQNWTSVHKWYYVYCLVQMSQSKYRT